MNISDQGGHTQDHDDPHFRIDHTDAQEGREFFYCQSCGVVGKTGEKNPLCLGLCNIASCTEPSLLEAAKATSLKLRKVTVLRHLETKKLDTKDAAMSYMTGTLQIQPEEAESIWQIRQVCVRTREHCARIPEMPSDPD